MTIQQRPRVFAGTTAANQGDFAPRDWALFFSISLIWGASFLLIAESLESLTPGMVTLGRVAFGAVTGLLNGATPVLVAVVSVLFLRVAPRGLQLVGLLLGFSGIVLISLGSAAEGSSQAKGVVLVLAATFCYGFAINLAPPLQAKYGGVVLMSSVLGVASLMVVPYALVDLGDNSWQASSLIAIVALGSIGTGLAYWIMSSLVGRVGSIRASFITYLVPVVSLLLGVILRGDTVTGLALIGTPATILGAFLASRRATSPTKPTNSPQMMSPD